jgi:cytochrome c oxidase subunit II
VQKWWSLLFGVVLAASFGLFVVAYFVPGWWLPTLANAQTFGAEVDKLFYLILWLTGFFFVLTEVILVIAMWRYAYQPGRRAVYVHGNHKLELAWTLVPAAILLFITFAQISAWADIKYANRMQPPQHVIEVSARQFEWRFRYPDVPVREKMIVEEGAKEWPVDRKKYADTWGFETLGDDRDLHVVNEVHTWKGANTRVYLKTRDVLHSFFLPVMRLKQDAVPGKVIPVWFRSDIHNGEYVKGTTPGEGKWVYEKDGDQERIWELACAELCGWGHYKMQGRLYVHKDRKSYDAWLADALAKERATSRVDSK